MNSSTNNFTYLLLLESDSLDSVSVPFTFKHKVTNDKEKVK